MTNIEQAWKLMGQLEACEGKQSLITVTPILFYVVAFLLARYIEKESK